MVQVVSCLTAVHHGCVPREINEANLNDKACVGCLRKWIVWFDCTLGDFLLARSSMSLARLRSLESVELMSAAIEHLVKV